MAWTPPRPLFAAAALLLTAGCPDEDLLNTTYDLCVEPAETDFGDTTVRSTTIRTVQVINCGSTPIDGLDVVFTAQEGAAEADAEAFAALATEVETPLAAGGRFLLPVRFRPTDAHAYAVNMDFYVPDSDQTLETAPLTGNGTPPTTCDLLVAPDPVDFDDTEVGYASAPRTINLTNQGNGPCAIDAVRLTAGHADFVITDDSLTEVAAGQTVGVEVTFAPQSPGTRAGMFSVVTAGVLEFTAVLGGEALPSERCRLALDPAPLSFPRGSVDFSTTTADAEVVNNGEIDCTFTGATITALDTDYSITAAPSTGTLAPGARTAITVAFAPTAAGDRLGTLSLASAEEPDVEVDLVAFADPTPTCGLLFDPSPVSFPPRGVGLTEEVTVTIENASMVDCHIASTALSPDAAPEFSLITGAPAGTLLPGETTTATVSYTPIAAAPSTGDLIVTFDDGTTQKHDLLGFGDFADLVLTPGVQYFGTVTEGCVSRTFEATLTNVGPVAARLDSTAFSAATDPNFELLTPISPGDFLASGEARPLALRMLSGPGPGQHSGHLEVFSTGAKEPVERHAVFGTTAALSAADVVDVFTQSQTPAVDILFVIDNSGSMLQEQQSIAQNFSSFINFTVGLNIDYHIGVVTTDVSDADAGKLVAPYIANIGPDASADPIGDFVAMVNVGTDGSATEKGLAASVLAVTEPLVSTANGGFLRPDALLSVIYVSDEDDFSEGDVSDYVDGLLSAKGYDSQAVIASAIAGEPPAGCDANGNSASSGDRYYDISLALEGLFESICTPDWSTTMEEIGIGTFSALTRFTLTRIPDEATIVVLVNGVPIPADELNGWEYNEENNSISFNGTSVPDAGATVEISYTAECLVP